MRFTILITLATILAESHCRSLDKEIPWSDNSVDPSRDNRPFWWPNIRANVDLGFDRDERVESKEQLTNSPTLSLAKVKAAVLSVKEEQEEAQGEEQLARHKWFDRGHVPCDQTEATLIAATIDDNDDNDKHDDDKDDNNDDKEGDADDSGDDKDDSDNSEGKEDSDDQEESDSDNDTNETDKNDENDDNKDKMEKEDNSEYGERTDEETISEISVSTRSSSLVLRSATPRLGWSGFNASSILVEGDKCCWEFFDRAGYVGNRLRLCPGSYDASVLSSNKVASNIKSARPTAYSSLIKHD